MTAWDIEVFNLTLKLQTTGLVVSVFFFGPPFKQRLQGLVYKQRLDKSNCNRAESRFVPISAGLMFPLTLFFRPTPLGFRQVVQHARLHVAYWLIHLINAVTSSIFKEGGLQKLNWHRTSTQSNEPSLCRRNQTKKTANQQNNNHTQTNKTRQSERLASSATSGTERRVITLYHP